jgi:CheY-like chemotaxis protein
MDTGPERAEMVGRRRTCTPPRWPFTLPPLEVTSGFARISCAEGKATFARGGTAMIVGGTADYAGSVAVNTDVKLDFIAFPPPSATAGAPATVGGLELLYTVNAKSRAVDAAVQVLDWLSTPESNRLFANSITLPTVKGVVPGPIRSGRSRRRRTAPWRSGRPLPTEPAGSRRPKGAIPLVPGRPPCLNRIRMTGPAAPPSPYRATVRRGRAELFVAVDTCLGDTGVDVGWDRRAAERRRRTEAVPGDRRVRERRRRPPPSWRWSGLLYADGPRGPALRAGRILVVEDDPRVRELLHEALTVAGYEVLAAADGEEALAVYAATPADPVITDLLMPRRDGVETIRGLRARHPDARVIAVTAARGRFSRLTAARHVGAHHTLLKPFDVGELLEAVHEALGR